MNPSKLSITISEDSKKNAETCLKILGGIITDYDRRQKFRFTIQINNRDYHLDRSAIKLLKIQLVKTYGLSTKRFHNAFEEALGLPYNSTII